MDAQTSKGESATGYYWTNAGCNSLIVKAALHGKELECIHENIEMPETGQRLNEGWKNTLELLSFPLQDMLADGLLVSESSGATSSSFLTPRLALMIKETSAMRKGFAGTPKPLQN